MALAGVLACLFATSELVPLPGLSGVATAAIAPVKQPRPIRPTGYAVDIQDEVMTQNLNCDDINRFRSKLEGESMLAVAEEILDEPQHAQETSSTLFGDVLTRLILTASGSPSCTRIVPETYAPDARACRGGRQLGIVDRGMNSNTPALLMHAGELHLLGMFDDAAKLRNCHR